MKDYSNSRYLAIGPGYYGKGDSSEEAMENFVKHGGSRAAHVLYELPEGATHVVVDNMGGIKWKWADGADRSAQPRILSEQGTA